ncbi:MAG: hypothetical protein QOF83_1383 [Solirubrobacteraceae bacterium]|jgi:hypothetical protein|nr:hypothetical protein [Solirubrobacteraceae bacterium]
MPRVLVTDDSGEMAWDERVTHADFESGHFRAQLSDRLLWAVADATRSQTPDPPSDLSQRAPTGVSPPHVDVSCDLARSST